MDDVKVGNFKSFSIYLVGFYLEVLYYLGIFRVVSRVSGLIVLVS